MTSCRFWNALNLAPQYDGRCQPLIVCQADRLSVRASGFAAVQRGMRPTDEDLCVESADPGAYRVAKLDGASAASGKGGRTTRETVNATPSALPTAWTRTALSALSHGGHASSDQ